MNKGTLGERYIESSVLPKINNVNKTLEQGAGIGNDFSQISGIISASGTGTTPENAFHKCYNNFLCSGGEALGMHIIMTLPESAKESMVKGYMDTFSQLSVKYSVQILGGNTEICDGCFTGFTVFIIGRDAKFSFSKKKIDKGCHIVLANPVGIFGTNYIISEKRAQLSKRFDGMYLENAIKENTNFSVFSSINVLKYSDRLIDTLYYIHDVSFGGIYAALWQLGKWSGRGFVIDNRQILINQETIEICEFFDINPYCIDSTGSLLIVCKNGFDVVAELKKHGIAASVIGSITDEKERLIKLSDSDFRKLTPVAEDEIYKIVV